MKWGKRDDEHKRREEAARDTKRKDEAVRKAEQAIRVLQAEMRVRGNR